VIAVSSDRCLDHHTGTRTKIDAVLANEGSLLPRACTQRGVRLTELARQRGPSDYAWSRRQGERMHMRTSPGTTRRDG
jgi:hypothetical protein